MIIMENKKVSGNDGNNSINNNFNNGNNSNSRILCLLIGCTIGSLLIVSSAVVLFWHVQNLS